jgi:hypothetical protein
MALLCGAVEMPDGKRAWRPTGRALADAFSWLWTFVTTSEETP